MYTATDGQLWVGTDMHVSSKSGLHSDATLQRRVVTILVGHFPSAIGERNTVPVAAVLHLLGLQAENEQDAVNTEELAAAKEALAAVQGIFS